MSSILVKRTPRGYLLALNGQPVAYFNAFREAVAQGWAVTRGAFRHDPNAQPVN